MSWDPNQFYKDTEVAAEYDRVRFSSLAGKVFNWLEQRCIRRAFGNLPTGAHICDLPCGTGRHAEVLLECGYRVTGIDISPAMLDVTKRKLGRFGDRFSAVVGDAREMASTGMKFDAALCARVLMHFPLPEQITFLRGVAELSEGKVVITQSLNTPYQRARRKFKSLWSSATPAVFPITNSEVDRLLRESGLREVRRYRVMPPISEAAIIVAERRGSAM